MEKLIELLNEYEKELNTGLHWRIDEKYGMLWRGLNLMGVDQYLISKHYGFIKWLVDNDKIDQTNKFCVSVNVEGKGMGYTKAFDSYESLLMLLTIQDEPLEFLISILK